MNSSFTPKQSFDKYISHFFSLNAASDLLPFFIGCKRRAGKEVTESIGMFRAAQDLNINFENTIVIVPGDGKRPRTGAIFSFLTRAVVHSIDPIMDLEWFNKILPERFNLKPKRLNVYQNYGKDIKIDCAGKDALLCLCHSHCHMKEALDIPRNFGKLTIINCPCCVDVPPQYLTKEYTRKHNFRFYKDSNIWSPKNKVYSWVIDKTVLG